MTFLQFEGKGKFSHALENSEGAESVDFGIIREDEKIIHIDNEPSFGNHVSERVVHKSLESGRGVAKSKEHDSRFKESLVSNESCFPLVSVLDSNIVIP